MNQLDFLLIDVFTDRPFGGSRLTLFPAAGGLSGAMMQQLAQEMGPGETAFVQAAVTPDCRRSGLRVFTPEAELPFAGHAILGASFAIDELGLRGDQARGTAFTWDLEAGPCEVAASTTPLGIIYSMSHGTPSFLGEYYHRGKVAQALGLSEAELAITGLPCEIISTGLPIHVVPVGSLTAVRNARLRRREADAIARDPPAGDLFLFTPSRPSPEATVHCRMFAPHYGIPEDPASGALGALAAYLVKHRLARPDARLTFVGEQGLELGRPSRLYVEADIVGGRAVNIHVGGQCVLVGQGRIRLP
ncbi:MAG: PhzF family phenazine biosynthesis protein [Candidatus Krumholzibacteriia bacterium]